MELAKLNKGSTLQHNVGYRGEPVFVGGYKFALIGEAKGRKKKNFTAGETYVFEADEPIAPYKVAVFVEANPELYAAGHVSFQKIWASDEEGKVRVRVTFTEDTKVDKLAYLVKVCATWN